MRFRVTFKNSNQCRVQTATDSRVSTSCFGARMNLHVGQPSKQNRTPGVVYTLTWWLQDRLPALQLKRSAEETRRMLKQIFGCGAHI